MIYGKLESKKDFFDLSIAALDKLENLKISILVATDRKFLHESAQAFFWFPGTKG